MRWNLILLVSGIVLFLVMAMWPLRYPLLTKEENPSATAIERTPVQDEIVMPDQPITGLVLWTNQYSKALPDAMVTLHLESSRGTVTIEKKLSAIFNSTDRSLHFRFPATSFDSATQVHVVATSEGLPYQLPLRYQLLDGGRLAYQLEARGPLTTVLLKYIYGLRTDGEDISYMYNEGSVIASGGNPYDCVTQNDCLDHKTPAYFPLFYWLAAATQKAGLTEYDAWIGFWKPVFLIFYVGIAGLIMGTSFWRKQTLLGIAGALLWLGNRWSLYVLRVGQTDVLALFFLVASTVIIPQWYWVALGLLSISLAIKQVAIFLVPLYLVYAWQRSSGSWKKRIAHFIGSALVIGSVPVISALPFLVRNPRAVIEAIFFSVARGGGADLGAPPLGTILYLSGTSRLLIVLLLVGFVVAAIWFYKLPLVTAALLIFVGFLSFNTVLFNQYFVWMIPFVPLAAIHWGIPLYTKDSP